MTYEYKGYFNPRDLNAFEIIKAELTKINSSLKIKRDLVKGLREIKIQFENPIEYKSFLEKLIELGLRNDRII